MITSFVRTGIFSAALLFGIASAHAFEVPINDGFVTDEIGLLTADQEETLETDLTSYRMQTSNEIAVVIVRTLSGTVASDVAVEIGRKWGVGTEEDNGILMLISYEDRQIWISTGYGLEGAVPDLVATGIAEEDIAPAFRDGEYYDGIAAGIDALKKHIGGEYTAERYDEGPDVSGFFPWIIFLVFIVGDWFAALFSRSKSWWLGGIFGGIFGIVLTILFSWWISIPAMVLLGLIFDYIVSKHPPRRGRGGWRGGPPMGGSGWSGGSGSSSGGFGGFSGGSFGGGGGGSKW